MATQRHRRYRGFDRFLFIPAIIVALLALQAGCNEAPATDKKVEDRLTAAEARVKTLEADVAALRAQLATSQGKSPDSTGATAAGAGQAKPAEPANDATVAANKPDPAEPVNTGGGGAAGAAGAGATPQTDPAGPINGMTTITPNPAMKGIMGRVVVAFPKDAKIDQTHVEVMKPGDKKASASGYGNFAADLMPGKYDVTISGAVVPGVEVKSKNDTNVAVGVLRTSANAQTQITVTDKSGKKPIINDYGSKEFGLPPGTYTVTVSGQSMPVEIKAGQATDF